MKKHTDIIGIIHARLGRRTRFNGTEKIRASAGASISMRKIPTPKPMKAPKTGISAVKAMSTPMRSGHFVWDEPLNFIDIYSRMQIERLILEMRPTLLLVEHDRAFRDAAAGKTVRMEPAAK